MMSDKIIIPLKPHIYQFFIHESNLGSSEPEIRKNGRFGSIFWVHLTHLQEEFSNEDLPSWYFERTCNLVIKPTFTFRADVITEERLVSLANALEQLFEEAMLRYIEGRCDSDYNMKKAMKRFFNLYNLKEDDIKLDSTYRALNRTNKAIRETSRQLTIAKKSKELSREN